MVVFGKCCDYLVVNMKCLQQMLWPNRLNAWKKLASVLNTLRAFDLSDEVASPLQYFIVIVIVLIIIKVTFSSSALPA